MDKIKFADGTEYDCSFCATIPDNAYIALANVDFPTVAAVFSDTTKTARMEYGNNVLVGFTTLIAVGVQPYGIQAVLRGGTVQEIQQEGD